MIIHIGIADLGRRPPVRKANEVNFATQSLQETLRAIADAYAHVVAGIVSPHELVVFGVAETANADFGLLAEEQVGLLFDVIALRGTPGVLVEALHWVIEDFVPREPKTLLRDGGKLTPKNGRRWY